MAIITNVITLKELILVRNAFVVDETGKGQLLRLGDEGHVTWVLGCCILCIVFEEMEMEKEGID